MQNGEKKVWNSDVLHRGRFIIIWNSPIYNKYVQYGLSLNRNGNSGRSCLETAFETF